MNSNPKKLHTLNGEKKNHHCNNTHIEIKKTQKTKKQKNHAIQKYIVIFFHQNIWWKCV